MNTPQLLIALQPGDIARLLLRGGHDLTGEVVGFDSYMLTLVPKDSSAAWAIPLSSIDAITGI